MTKTLGDLYNQTEPIEQFYGACIEWGDRDMGPSIEWHDNIRFHAQRYAGDYASQTPYGEETGEQVKDRLQDDDEFLDRLWAELDRLMPKEFSTWVEWSQYDDDGGGDDEPAWPYIYFSFRLKENDGKLPPETTEEEAFNKLWPAIATFINITDPGTFNCPYLFTGEVMRAPEND